MIVCDEIGQCLRDSYLDFYGGDFLSWAGYYLQRKEEERSRKGEDGDEDLDEGWEYVEDGPAEIIWEGNEITVKKPRKKVRKGVNSGVLAVEVIMVVVVFRSSLRRVFVYGTFLLFSVWTLVFRARNVCNTII